MVVNLSRKMMVSLPRKMVISLNGIYTFVITTVVPASRT